MKKILLLTVIVLGLCSCEHIMNSRPTDFLIIKLSIGAQGCDTIITLQPQEDEWFLDDNHMTIDSKYIDFPVCDAVLSYETGLPHPVRPGVCSDSIMTVKYDIRSVNRVQIVQFEHDYLNFTKKTPYQIHLVVKQNQTGKTRNIGLPMSALYYIIAFDIIQSSE
jgi:hypothetical protein